MNLNHAVQYAKDKLAEGYKSDGCTFAPDFWIKECCVTHDMLRRFQPVTPARADFIYLLHMLKKLFPLAPIYYIAVVIARKAKLFS